MTDILKRVASKGDERRMAQTRAVQLWSQKRDLGLEILRAIPQDIDAEVVGLDLEAHTMHTKTALLLSVSTRADVPPLLAALKPQPLVNVQIERGFAQREWDTWPVSYEDRHAKILRRAALVPFVYDVEQGPCRLRHSVSWITRAKDERIVIVCDIEYDPARFIQETRGKIGERQEARWVRSVDYPHGFHRGHWNIWRPYYEQHDQLLECRVFWPMNSNVVSAEVRQLPVAEQAHSLLEVEKVRGYDGKTR